MALGFIKVLREPFDLLLLRVEFHPVARISFFLDLHAQDVRVHGQGDLVGHGFDLALLALNCAPHVVQSLVKRLLDVFTRLDLLAQPGLVGRGLLPHLLIVLFEVVVQDLQLFFLGMRGL